MTGGPPRLHTRLLKNQHVPRLLKKAQMQGGTPQAERGVLDVRRSECRGGPTQQMGLFQQPDTPQEVRRAEPLERRGV